MLIILIIAVLIVFVVLLRRGGRTENLMDNFNEEIKSISNQMNVKRQEQILEEKHKIDVAIAAYQLSTAARKDELEREKKRLEMQLQTKREEVEKEIEALTKEKFLTLNEKENEFKSKVEEIDHNLLLKKAEYDVKVERIQADFEEKQNELVLKIKEKENQIKNLIENFKKDEEIRKEKDFYRIVIPAAAQEDIQKLKLMANQLNDPSVLYKLIWKQYYESGFSAMIGRVLGADKDKSGIYKITNIKNQMCYVGQTTNFAARWRTHSKRSVKAEPTTNNKLYGTMWEEGLENFTFQVLEFCPKEKLTERERYFINCYHSRDYGYNSKD